MSESKITQDPFVSKTKFQIKLGICFLFIHSFCYYPLGTYSYEFFMFMFITTGFMTSAHYVELHYQATGHILKSVLFGILPALTMFFKPEYALFATLAHFFAINVGFYDIDLSKLHYLLGSNILAWISCYCYFKFRTDKDYAGAQEIKYLWEDPHRFSRFLMVFAMNYGATLLLARNKLAEIEVHENYKSALLSLNKELEDANLKLQTTNADLQDALQEKENFILRFSHEIRNPLNSLLGNVELCYEKAHDSELRTMLQDAKVSGEILLQLLNNVLDTAKVAVGRLELSVSSQLFRGFLERAWVICSEIIRKKGLDGCLSVSYSVPDTLEFDHHRLMQILINTISNATKFTESGYVKMFIDFEICAEIQQRDMKPRHKQFISESGNEREREAPNEEEEMSEKPRYSYECLTLSRRLFKSAQRTLIEGPGDSTTTIHIPYTSRNPTIGQYDIIPDSNKVLSLRDKWHQPRPESLQGFIRLEVIDSGCGIQKKDLDSLFSKFSQVSRDTSKRQIGTGLGLWITKEIIELMEGRIGIFSAPNQGTALVITIKSKSSSSPASQAVKLSSSLVMKPSTVLTPTCPKSFVNIEPEVLQRVLVVEDMPYNQEVNQRFLQKCNVQQILIANNGQEALDMYKKANEQQYFDLILMDIDMPVMDGKTATKKIREFEKERGWSPTSTVFLTAYAEAKTQSELLNPSGEYRANGFLAKPASLETIRRTLSKKGNKSQNTKTTNGLRFPDRNQNTILIVDDDPSNRIILSKMVDLCGYKTLEARNGQMALDLYEKNWKDIKLVLMDYEMPVMDGYEATRRMLLKHKKLADIMKKEIKVYGLTGYVGKDNQQRCLEAGMKGVLEKPITIDRLRSLLLTQD